jgi:hypothetical protein
MLRDIGYRRPFFGLLRDEGVFAGQMWPYWRRSRWDLKMLASRAKKS